MTRWQMFREWLTELRRERLERRALSQAMEAFAQIHPGWYEAFFDEPFLARFEPGTVMRMDPRELATEWARQLGFGDPARREREIVRTTEVAAHLQELMAEALRRLERSGARALLPSQRSTVRRGTAVVNVTGTDAGRPGPSAFARIHDRHAPPQHPLGQR